MEIIIGLIIIAIGSFGQSSSYVPINKVKDWSWESFWLVQGIFAWLVFPFLGALLAIPDGSSLPEVWSAGGAAGAVVVAALHLPALPEWGQSISSRETSVARRSGRGTFKLLLGGSSPPPLAPCPWRKWSVALRLLLFLRTIK